MFFANIKLLYFSEILIVVNSIFYLPNVPYASYVPYVPYVPYLRYMSHLSYVPDLT